MPADGIALQIADLHVHYGPVHVLQGVALAVPDGKVTAIVGRNGVGKTTLINSVMGMIPATGGTVSMAGTNLLARPAHERKALGLGLVPQGRRLFGSLTVEEHLRLVRPIREGPMTVETIYDLFPPLGERRRALAPTLSGGERSMLSISRALVLNPSILLMDEPTEGLAPLLVDEIAATVNRLQEDGMTILLVEQKLSFSLDVAQRIAVMGRGSISHIFERGEVDDVDALSRLILGSENAA